MRRRLGVVIGFELDDPAAYALEQQGRANEIARHCLDVAGKERTAKRTRHDRLAIDGGCLIEP
jgi:hypothetical protein